MSRLPRWVSLARSPDWASAEAVAQPILRTMDGRSASPRVQAKSCGPPATNRPDGQINSDFQKSCQARESKIFPWRRRANHFYNSARLTRQEGRIMIVTNVG